MRAILAALCLGFGLSSSHGAPLDGKWSFVAVLSGAESIQAVIQFETKDGKTEPKILFTPQNSKGEISNFQLTEKSVSFRFRQTLQFGQRSSSVEVEFIGIRGNDPKVILGSSGPVDGDDRARQRAKLVATEITQPLPSELVTRLTLPEPMLKIQEMNRQGATLQTQLRTEKDDQKKAELQKKLTDLMRERDEKSPQWLREVLTKHADDPAAFDAAISLANLARTSRSIKLTADDALQIVAIARRHAEPYGVRFLVPTLVQLAEAFVGTTELLAASLQASEIATHAVTDEFPLALQSRCLQVYQLALEKSGRTADAQPIAARLTKIEAKLDEEYRTKVPPFEAQAFEGRKRPDANQVVLMELFTGAQCPPCVAADVAFDALLKTYQPKDVVLVQYHIHIPGPDPMTNPATLARWNYYRQKFPDAIRGVPSSLFNGSPKAGGGGGMANSLAKYNQYCDVINGLLNSSSPIALSGRVTRDGDVIKMDVEVQGAKTGGDSDLKLRLLLIEKEIKFVGSNSIRFHHHVVRAMPGGPEGVAIQGTSFRHTASINLTELRKELASYLETYEKEQRPFPQPGRPLNLDHLKVIAFVQDDQSGTIQQAVQWDVAKP